MIVQSSTQRKARDKKLLEMLSALGINLAEKAKFLQVQTTGVTKADSVRAAKINCLIGYLFALYEKAEFVGKEKQYEEIIQHLSAEESSAFF